MNKVTDLWDRLERVKLNRENRPDPDDLSKSLWEFGREMASLSKDDMADLAAKMVDEDGRQILTLEETREFARDYAV